MNKDQLKDRLKEIDKKIDGHNKAILSLMRKAAKARDEYAENNAPYPTGTIVRVKERVGLAVRNRLAVITGWHLTTDLDVKPFLSHLAKYDNNRANITDGKTYYYEQSPRDVRYDDIIGMTPVDASDAPMLTCDNCAWLEAYHNTRGKGCPKLHCGILIDGNVYEEGHPACKRYSRWTWDDTMTHREQLLRDDGGLSDGEREAKECFGKALQKMAGQC